MKMRKNTGNIMKRSAALFLALVMVCAMFPGEVFADLAWYYDESGNLFAVDEPAVVPEQPQWYVGADGLLYSTEETVSVVQEEQPALSQEVPAEEPAQKEPFTYISGTAEDSAVFTAYGRFPEGAEMHVTQCDFGGGLMKKVFPAERAEKITEYKAYDVSFTLNGQPYDPEMVPQFTVVPNMENSADTLSVSAYSSYVSTVPENENGIVLSDEQVEELTAAGEEDSIHYVSETFYNLFDIEAEQQGENKLVFWSDKYAPIVIYREGFDFAPVPWVLTADRSVTLSSILETAEIGLGLSDIAEQGIIYLGDPELVKMRVHEFDGDWEITSAQGFSAAQVLKVLFKNGGVLNIELYCEGNEPAPVAETEKETWNDWVEMFRDVELSGSWPQDVVTIAKTQLGYTASETDYDYETHKGYTRYGAWYGNEYGDWCAMFCSFCMAFAGVDREVIPFEQSCERWIEQLKVKELYQPAGNGYTPKAGDLIFFSSNSMEADHVGIVYENEPGQIVTIDGNNPGQVEHKFYLHDDARILGYGEMPAATVLVENTIESAPAEDGAVAVITGCLPKGAEAVITAVALSAEEISEYLGADAAGAITECVAYDIKIMVNGEEWQPEEEVSVVVRQPEIELVENGGVAVAHVESETEEVTNVEAVVDKNNEISFITDGFSKYIFYTFTVDYYYGDAEYHQPGMSTITFSKLFDELGIDLNVIPVTAAADEESEAVAESAYKIFKEIANVTFSDDTLLAVEYDEESGDWTLKSLKPFSTSEMLTGEFEDGTYIVISVADDIDEPSLVESGGGESGEVVPADIDFLKYEKETSATGIEGSETGTENVHTICLDVVPPEKRDIAVLMVMDTTSSMTVNCVTCGVSSDYHPGGSKYNPASPFAYWHWDNTWGTYAVCNDFTSRKDISEGAAFAFIERLANLSENTDNVYVRIVPFGGTATTDYTPWIDLSTTDGVADAKEKIRDLPKISNTNISAGLRGAYDIISGTLPEGVTSENTYVIMMTDGSQSISDKANLPEEILNDEAFLNKWLNIWSNYDHFEQIENDNIDIGFYIGSPYYAELIRDKDGLGSHLYTVMLGNNIDHGTKSGGDKNQKYNPGIGIDSKDFMASFSDYSSMVTTADGMIAYYDSIISALSPSLETITVTDPMSDYVDFLTFTDSDGAQAAADAATYDLQTRTITWNPKDAAPDEDGHYRLYYNVRLKTEKSGYVAGQSYPANGTTTAAYTLKYFDNHTEDRTKDAVVPTLTGGALGQLSFTKISEDGDPITGAQFKLVHDDDCSYCSGATVSDIPFASGENGIATAIGIPSGHSYKLYETAAPEGYRPFEGALRVTVSYGEVTVIGSEGIWKKEGNVYYLTDPKEKDIGGPFYVVSQNRDYPTLQEAIDAAADEDTIKVRPCSEFEVTEYDSSYATNIPDYIGDDGGEAYAEGKSLTFTSFDPDEPATLKDFAIVLEGSTTSKHNYTFDNLKFTGSSIIILDNFEPKASYGTIKVNGCYADTCTSTHNRALLKYPAHNLGLTHSSSAFLQWVQYPQNRENNGSTDALVFTGNTIKGTLHPENPGDQKYTCFINGGAGPINVTITGNTFGDYAHSKSTFGIVFQTMSNNASINVSNNSAYMANKSSHFVWLGQFYPLERNGISVNVNNNNIYTGSSMANPPTRPYNLNSDKTVATPSFNVVYVSNTLNGTAVTYHNYVNGYCYNNIKISVNKGYSFIANQQIGHTDDERIQEVPYGSEKFNDIYLFGKADDFEGGDHHDRDIGTDHYCINCDELIELKNLTVTKEVAGCVTEEEFEFKASVINGTFRESKNYTINADGTVNFKLKQGNSLTLLTNKGATVTISETAASGFYTMFKEVSTEYVKKCSTDSFKMTDDRSITVVNTAGVELPKTGGKGISQYYATGAMLIASACLGIILKRKRERRAA